MSEDNIDTIIKNLYLDPLISGGVTSFSDSKQKEKVMRGDFHVNLFISKLDEEIFSDIPIMGANLEENWKVDNLSAMCVQLLDFIRLHGWASVQFYKKAPVWRVFSECDRTKWIYDEDKNIIGITVHYGEIKNEECIFGKNQCYLVKFKEGNNKDIFAYPDLDEAMWTVATICREIQTQLNVMGQKPEFWLAKYGNPTPDQRKIIMNALDDTSILNALGMNEDALKGIDVIKHESYDNLMSIIDRKTKRFAGLTRLPLAFYNGERDSGSGTGGAAENVVELKIEKRKVYIFNILKDVLTKIYLDRYGQTLGDISLEVIEVKPITEDVNEQDDKIDKIKETSDNIGQ